MSTQETTSASQPAPDPVLVDVLLSLATAPLMMGLVAEKVLLGVFQDIGTLSEEVFRGDRLPLLPFPKPSSLPATGASESDSV